MIETRPLEVTDFSGGITDNHIEAPLNRYQRADNFIVTTNRKLYTRPGSELYDSANPQIPLGSSRVGTIVSFNTDLLVHSSRRIYFDTSWTQILGPTGNPLFPATTSTAHYTTHSDWNNHLFIANDNYEPVSKIYKDSGGTLRLRTAGLPKLATEPVLTGSIATIIALANDLKAKYNAHIADAAAHTTLADAVNTVTAANATNLATLITLVTELLTDYNAHEGDAAPAMGWTYHAGQESLNHTLASTTAPTDLQSVVDALTDLKTKLNAHDADDTAHGTINNHQVTAVDGTVNSYIYAFCYFYEYTVGGKTFQDFGGVTEVVLQGVDPPHLSAVAITAIPVIANGAIYNWDTTVIKVHIYRTTNGGTTFFKAGEITNGTTTFNDSTNDTVLLNQQLLYTTGGVVSNDPVPLCKIFHVAENIALAGDVKEGTEYLISRVRQSVPGDPDAFPEDFYVDVRGQVMGISSVRGRPVILTNRGIYRIDGFFDELGQGGMIAQLIDETVDCVSSQGVVQILDGILWAASDGFYFSDGYRVLKISDEFNTTYKGLVDTLTKGKRVQGAYDGDEQKVHWAVQADVTSTDNDTLFVLDLAYGLKPDACFTTWSGSTYFAPSAIAFHEKLLVRGDRRGYLFTHDEDFFSDPWIDELATPSTWAKRTIIFDYKSVATNFGSSFVRKWVPRMLLTASNRTNVSIDITSINDDARKTKKLAEIRFRGNAVWGDAELVWGDPSCVWNYEGLIEEQRRFPAGMLRCSYKQIQISNAFTAVTSSDLLGTATVDATLKTVLLDDAVNADWPIHAKGYYIAFESDGYAREYEVLIRSNDTLTYLDAANQSVGGSQEWVLRGYPKDEVLNLLGYVLHWAPLSKTQDDFKGSTGEVST